MTANTLCGRGLACCDIDMARDATDKLCLSRLGAKVQSCVPGKLQMHTTRPSRHSLPSRLGSEEPASSRTKEYPPAVFLGVDFPCGVIGACPPSETSRLNGWTVEG